MDGSREYYAVTSFRRKGKDTEWFHSCIKNTPSKRVTKATELELIHKRESMRWGWGLDGKDHWHIGGGRYELCYWMWYWNNISMKLVRIVL